MLEILASGGVQVTGLLDADESLWGSNVLGVHVLGGDDLLSVQRAAGVRDVFIGLGGSGDTRPRQQLYERARSEGFNVVDVIHPTAVVSPSATVGAGATMMANAVVNAAATLGENVIVNTGAIIEHDCSVGSHVHVASGARLAGSVQVGDGAHIGLGAAVNPGVRIGARAIVGSGAVVVRDVEPGDVVVGVPARVLRSASV